MFDTNESNKAGAFWQNPPPFFRLIGQVKPPRFGFFNY